MQDKELYQHLLSLTAPWTFSEVKHDMQSQEIHVGVEHPRGTKFGCPDCQKQLPCYDHHVKSVSGGNWIPAN
jgi:transposase